MPLTLLPTAPPPRAGFTAPGGLVVRLAGALAKRGASYCQWKGHGKRERWERGRGDIDLLVDPASWADFIDVAGELGFKLALPPAGREAAGIVHYYGLDGRTGQLIHLHVYQKLIIGLPWRTHYRLPLERAALASATHRDGTTGTSVFKIPAPELELIVAVLRLSLRHMLRDSVRRTPPVWLNGALSEVDRLEDQVTPDVVYAALRQHLPEVSVTLFTRCRGSLQPGCPAWRRVATRAALVRALSAHRTGPTVLGIAERLWRRVRPRGQRLASGGTVVALLGSDGSGKSTCAEALTAWLGPALATMHLHLGRPPRSVTTLIVGAASKVMRGIGLPARVLDHLELLRTVCTGRDRQRLYRRAFRFAAAGGIAICERYPSRESWALSGPSEVQGHALAAQSALATRLRSWERGVYERMARPDIQFLLELDPETAVSRKPSEPADYVRERAQLTAAADWSHSGAVVVDASQPLPQVLATLKAALWKTL